MKRQIAIFLGAVLLSGCSAPRYSRYNESGLSSITLLDRNDFSETITNKDRLKQYEHIDYTQAQPYQRILRINHRDEKGDIHAYMTTYHENGQPKQYLEIVNSRAFGNYREWHENGALKLEATILGGEADLSPGSENSWIFDGCAKGFDAEGNITAEIHYAKGKLHGDSLYYHPGGTLWKRVPFQNGEASGNFELFRETGELLQTTSYCSGVKHGLSKRYWNQELVASDELYNSGALISSKSYSKDGELIAQVENGNGYRATFGKERIAELQQYIDGQPNGEVHLFADDGTLSRLHHVKDGVKHGEEIDYFPGTRQPRISVNWSEGNLQGVIRTWYKTGQQESQREMSGNKKNGLLMAWYKDGGVMLIEEYEADKLIKGKYFKKGEKHPVSTIRNGDGEATLYDGNGHYIRKITYKSSQPLIH